MSWWFDRIAVEQTLQLKRDFNVNTFIETGTFRGINLRFWAYYFKDVWGCDIEDEYISIAQRKLANRNNVKLFKMNSNEFIKMFISNYRRQRREDIVIFYLDAHFYKPNALPEDRWVVKKELDTLKNFDRGIVIIHDFDCNGLGHICYDGEDLNFNLVKEYLEAVNQNFHYYVNKKEFCNPHTLETIKGVSGLFMDEETIETINYHNVDRLKYRGILYCIPSKLNLKKYKLEQCKQCK